MDSGGTSVKSEMPSTSSISTSSPVGETDIVVIVNLLELGPTKARKPSFVDIPDDVHEIPDKLLPPPCFSLPFLVVPASCLILSVRLRHSVSSSQSLNLCNFFFGRSPFTTLVAPRFIQHLCVSDVDVVNLLRLCI